MNIIQTWATKNDSSGNPRRIDVIFGEEGELVEVVEHGYSGPVPRSFWVTNGAGERDRVSIYVDLGTVDVTPSEYNAMKKRAKDQGIYS